MALLRCNACGGEYRDIQRDGTRYFHVCPPEIVVTFRDQLGTEEERPLAQCAGLELLDADTMKAIADKGDVLKPTQRAEIARRDAARADRRDERPDPLAAAHRGQRPPRRPGPGVTVLKTDAELAREDADAL